MDRRIGNCHQLIISQRGEGGRSRKSEGEEAGGGGGGGSGRSRKLKEKRARGWDVSSENVRWKEGCRGSYRSKGRSGKR